MSFENVDRERQVNHSASFIIDIYFMFLSEREVSYIIYDVK